MSSSGLTTIHKLDDAATFLMLVSDRAIKQTCGLTPQEALNLMQPLHAMIDSESKNITTSMTAQALETCSDNCHCGLYFDLATDTKLKNDFYEKASKLPRNKLVSCAEVTSKWLCSDELLKELESSL
jgi:hypothetical protein